MALILSLETSTTVCSAALHQSGKLVSVIQHNIPQSAASKLAVIVDHLFKITEYQPSQLNAVAVSAGPGSYTGLRIGVATAKGICYALNIPLIAINTLELMAYQVAKNLSVQNPNKDAENFHNLLSTQETGTRGETLLCPMLDARRMEVYTLLSKTNLEIVETTDAKIIDENSYHDKLQSHHIIFFGDGAAKCKQIIQHANAEFIDGIVPSAAELGHLAFNKFQNNQFEDLNSYEPYYLKDFLIKKPKSFV